MRRILAAFVSMAFFAVVSLSQTVRTVNRYGDAVVYVDGNSIRDKNRYGDVLFVRDGNTVRLNSR